VEVTDSEKRSSLLWYECKKFHSACPTCQCCKTFF